MPPQEFEVGETLACAIVAASLLPTLSLTRDLEVVAASESFSAEYAAGLRNLAGLVFPAFCGSEWDRPQIAALLNAAASGFIDDQTYEFDLVRSGFEPRQLLLAVRRLEHGSARQIRLLVIITDLTASRLAERMRLDLIHDKSLLLRELQHRVGNSLQIIASVLMQTARRVSSDETRSYLYDAHSRVLSVAELQRQLSVTGADEVSLRSYISALCRSIAPR